MKELPPIRTREEWQAWREAERARKRERAAFTGLVVITYLTAYLLLVFVCVWFDSLT